MSPRDDLTRLPQRLRDYFEKGAAAYEQGNDTYAVELLLRVVRAQPLFIPARSLLRAAERRWLQAHPPSVVARLAGLARHLYFLAAFSMAEARGKAYDALSACEGNLRANPDDSASHRRIARLAEREGWLAVAAQAYEDIWSAHPDNLEALTRLGELYRELADPQKAHFFLQKAVSLAPHDPRVLRQLKDVDALGTLARGGWQDTAPRPTRAQEPERSEPTLADRPSAAGDSLEAKLEHVRAKLQHFPNDLTLHLETGRLMFELGRTDEALAELQIAVKGPAQQAQALYLLGCCFQAKRMTDLAVREYQKALERPELEAGLRKDVLYKLGTALEENGQREEALKTFKELYAQDIHYRDVAQRIERAYKGPPSN